MSRKKLAHVYNKCISNTELRWKKLLFFNFSSAEVFAPELSTVPFCGPTWPAKFLTWPDPQIKNKKLTWPNQISRQPANSRWCQKLNFQKKQY